MRKILRALLIVTLIADLAGCATVQRKFTRKKKEPKHVAQAIAFDKGEFEKKYSNEYYYKTHYTYWKAWQGEWIDGLAGNRKRTARNGQEALSHLEGMTHYLKPEKTRALQNALKELGGIQKTIEAGQLTGSGVGPIRTELEKWRRLITNDYSYEEVRDSLLPDSLDLPGQ